MSTREHVLTQVESVLARSRELKAAAEAPFTTVLAAAGAAATAAQATVVAERKAVSTAERNQSHVRAANLHVSAPALRKAVRAARRKVVAANKGLKKALDIMHTANSRFGEMLQVSNVYFEVSKNMGWLRKLINDQNTIIACATIEKTVQVVIEHLKPEGAAQQAIVAAESNVTASRETLKNACQRIAAVDFSHQQLTMALKIAASKVNLRAQAAVAEELDVATAARDQAQIDLDRAQASLETAREPVHTGTQLLAQLESLLASVLAWRTEIHESILAFQNRDLGNWWL